MDREAWCATVHEAAKSRTLLSNWSLKLSFGLPCWLCWRRQWHPTPVLLPGKFHGRRSLVGCSPSGHYESDTTERLHFHFSLSHIGEGNGNPLQCSCLENPRDGGAWWAAICGVTWGWTWLKWLSSSSWLCGEESTCQCRSQRRLEFDPWVGRIPWRRKWQPTPVFLPEIIPWTEEPMCCWCA